MAVIDLHGKQALITGASSGLGADIARELARVGCLRLVLVARREPRLVALSREIEARHPGAEVEVVAMDLTEPGACERLAADHPDVDVLVNNAGFGLHGPFLDAPLERTLRMLDLDVRVLTELTHRFASRMRQRGSGHVLLVSSVLGLQAVPTYAAYGAAKSFVLLFGEALRHELAGSGVRVTTLAPGATRTEFLEVAGQVPGRFESLSMMSSDRVARTGVRALEQDRPTVIPGSINVAGALVNRLIPRWAQPRIAAQLINA